ncbi:DUF4386 domain-containing protein [Aquimarina sp. 2304DJ70-9]|uniref:DUF4386 domain-containing protein n=1 Tax=Aquimarina penaris TaxID=3231044 RepID=UPI00346344EF
MYTNKKTGRIVGVLFLIVFIIGALGTSLRGLSTSLVESENFLATVHENSLQMKIAILLDIISSTVGVGIAIFLFPFLKKYNNYIALLYLTFWIIEFSIIMVSNITHFSLLSLSQEFVQGNVSDPTYFNMLGFLKFEEYYWAHFLILIVYSSGAALFYYLLYKVKLIPRLLSAWAFIAVTIVFIVTWMQIFDYSVSFVFYLQNGVHFIVISIWLIVKGFNSTVIPTESVKPSIS